MAEPFACGGAAAMFASCCIHPIDLAKVRLQLLPPGKKPAFPIILANIVKSEGVTAVYAGLSASLLRQAIYGTARIGLHRTFSDYLIQRNNGRPISLGLKTFSGMLGGAIAVCIGTPMDVALVRMQSDSMLPEAQRRNYSNVFSALIRVTKEEGIRALWSGLPPNILRGMSMNAGMMASYDQAKEMVCEYITHDPDPSKPQLDTKLFSAAVAGFACAFFSLPFDLIKSRLQATPERYTGVFNAMTSVLKTEGILTFWTGFGAYYGRCAPHAMIILLTSESIRTFYRSTLGLNE